jgi:hypothetical protein
MAKHIVLVLLPEHEERSIDADSVSMTSDGDLILHRDGAENPLQPVAHFTHGAWYGYQLLDPPEAFVGYDKGARIGVDADAPAGPTSLADAVQEVIRNVAAIAAKHGLG